MNLFNNLTVRGNRGERTIRLHQYSKNVDIRNWFFRFSVLFLNNQPLFYLLLSEKILARMQPGVSYMWALTV